MSEKVYYDYVNDEIYISTSAASQWNNVTHKTNFDIVDADTGTLFTTDCTAGNITVSLPAISTLPEAWSVAIKKTDNSVNVITITQNSADTIEYGSSVITTEKNKVSKMVYLGEL
jgi:hypothetical protein